MELDAQPKELYVLTVSINHGGCFYLPPNTTPLAAFMDLHNAKFEFMEA